MTRPDPDTPKERMLREALEKARVLLAEVRRQQLELLNHPPVIPPEGIDEGKTAMEAAARSAERTVRALEAVVPGDVETNTPPPTTMI